MALHPEHTAYTSSGSVPSLKLIAIRAAVTVMVIALELAAYPKAGGAAGR